MSCSRGSSQAAVKKNPTEGEIGEKREVIALASGE